MVFRRGARKDGLSVAIARSAEAVFAVGLEWSEGFQPVVQWFCQVPADAAHDALRQIASTQPLTDVLPVGVLARGQYRWVVTDLPELPRQEWRDAMRWVVKDHIDFDVEDAVLDVLEVANGPDRRGAATAMVAVTPLAVAQDWWVQGDDVGLTWQALDVPEVALRNLSALAERDGKAHALMAFGATHALVVITAGGELKMSRTIEVHRAALTSAGDLARGSVLGRAGLEVLRTLDNHERAQGHAPLSGLSVVVPHGAQGVLEALSDLVYVPVQAFEVGDWLTLPQAIRDEAPMGAFSTLEALSALGAALRPWSQSLGRQQIDLCLPSAHRASPRWSALWALKGVCVVAALAFTLGMVTSTVNLYLQQRIAQTEAQLPALQEALAQDIQPPGLSELQALRKVEGQQQRLIDALARMVVGRTQGFGEHLMALGRQSMPGVWVTRFAVSQGGADLELTGRLSLPRDLPPYLDRLKAEPQFQGRSFEDVQMKALDVPGLAEQDVTEFSLKGHAVPPKAPAGGRS